MTRRMSIWAALALLAALPAARADAADLPATVSAGAGHTCALLAPSGRVLVLGRGRPGQLGDGTTTASPLPVTSTGLAGATG